MTKHQGEIVWTALSDEFPEADELVLLYNKRLSLYALDTIESVETDFKRYRQFIDEFAEIFEHAPDAKAFFRERYHFTHWCRIPEFPES
jgi:hypothetical protein